MKNTPETRAFLAALKHEVRSAQELLEALEIRNRTDAEILNRSQVVINADENPSNESRNEKA